MNIDYINFNPYVMGCGYHGKEDQKTDRSPYPYRVVRWYEFEFYHWSDGGYIINVDHRINLEKGLLMVRKPGTVVQGIPYYTCHTIAFDNIYDATLSKVYTQGIFEAPCGEDLKVILSRPSDFLMALPEMIIVSDYEKCHQLFKECFDAHMKRRLDFHLHSKRIILALIDMIQKDHQLDMQQLSHSMGCDKSYSILENVKKYLKSHYKEPITLTQLAIMAGYSKEAFCRQYKAYFGKSPIDDLLNIRLTHARRYLVTTRMTVEEIAFLCGFRSDSYFYRVFKKRSDMPPIAYRKAHKILE